MGKELSIFWRRKLKNLKALALIIILIQVIGFGFFAFAIPMIYKLDLNQHLAIFCMGYCVTDIVVSSIKMWRSIN